MPKPSPGNTEVTQDPLWLESPAIQQLLNLLVDRLDGAELRGSHKARAVALTERTWPALYSATFESQKEELWEHVVDMCRWRWIQVKPASAVCQVFGYGQGPSITVLADAPVRAAAGRLERVKSSRERWRAAVARSLSASDAVKTIVGDYCIDLPDHSMDEVVLALNRLPEFAGETCMLRELSAQLFWGMSKILDHRQGLVAAILGVDECPFPESPVQLQVCLQAGYSSVLFIENQMSFEQALSSTTGRFEGMALVFASGFKASAQRLRKPGSCSLFYSNRGQLGGPEAERFQRWLFRAGHSEAVPIRLWGDLDYSGMRILAAMRASFPGIEAWRTGYEPMLTALAEGQGHRPEAADKAGQGRIDRTGCPFADSQLLPALAVHGRFVGQEIFSL